MCSLPNIQPRDLEEFLKPRTKQTKKTEAETIEIIMSEPVILLNRVQTKVILLE
jgi:hypothetical protein